MPIDTREAYDEAMARLREHTRDCNCFLPQVSCFQQVEIMKQECSDFYLNALDGKRFEVNEAEPETDSDATSGSAT